MSEISRGTWWHVEPSEGKLRVSHGRTMNGRRLPPRAVVMVGLPAALELAVGLVHAALDIDPEQTQAQMLSLWVREQ